MIFTKSVRMKVLFIFLLLSSSALIAYAGEPPWAAPTKTIVKYTNERVNLRKGPSAEKDILQTLDPGAAIEFHSIYNYEWSAVYVNDTRGFIKSEFLSNEKPPVSKETLLSAERAFGSNEAISGDEKTPESNEGLINEEPRESDGELSEREKPPGGNDELLNDEELSKPIVELLDWSQVKPVFTIGVATEVYDVGTGLIYFVKSFSNGKHADVEPVTAEDTAIFKQTYNNRWSWDGRPVWVTINGRRIAGAINGMPHDGGVNNNNGMNGHVCLHFKGSSVHNSNMKYSQQLQAVVLDSYNAS